MEQEKEIVLGNKQLISFFFVVLALCGVFFALGYMIRGNALKQQAAAAPAPATDTAASSPSPLPPAQESEPPRETADTTQPTQPPASTAPVQSVEPPASASPAAQVITQPTTQSPPAPVTAAPLETGVSYLQVAALKRTDAENLVKTLREQNFPGLIEQSSRPELFRVLVGPYRQVADLADAKAKLKALGFANAQVEKK